MLAVTVDNPLALPLPGRPEGRHPRRSADPRNYA
jgi:hypothetical protein